MNFDEKLSAASHLINQHNLSVQEQDQINAEVFTAKLKQMGGTTNDALSECSWEDLQKCGLPPILARATAKIFRSNGDARRAFSRRQVEAMPVDELVAAYDPRDADNIVGSRLKTLSGGRRCVVFQSDGQVAVEPSTRLLRELRDGLPELSEVEWQGRVYKTHRVGERPNQTFDENPLFPGQPLRSDDTCGITGLDWAGIPLATRQLVYLAVARTQELTPSSKAEVSMLADWLTGNVEIKTKLRKAAVMFDELQSTGSLPSLKINATPKPKVAEGRKVQV